MGMELQKDGLMLKISGAINNPCVVSKSPVLEIQHYERSVLSSGTRK